MSNFRETEAVIKIGALKNFTNHTGKTPTIGSPLNKIESPHRLQKRNSPRNLQEYPFLQNTSGDGSFCKKAKYDFSLKVRGEFSYS